MAVRWSRPLKLRISLNTKANMLGKLVSWIQACAALEILQCWLSTSHLSSMNQTREHINCSASHVCINILFIYPEMIFSVLHKIQGLQ